MALEPPLGPNQARLVAHKAALLAIPPGSGADSMALGLAVLGNRERLIATTREAAAWVRQAIDAVKATHDNPFGDDDEAIAGAILRRIWQRTRARITPHA